MSKMLVVNMEKCTGCRTCELVCSFHQNGEYNPTKANIKVSGYPDKAFFVPVTCYQCDNPACAQVCPVGAIERTEIEGAFVVKVNHQKCIGCKMCTLACPFGNITYQSDGQVVKCELCEGNPECVAFCVTGALEYKEAETSTLRRKKQIAKKIIEAYQEGV